MVASALLLHLHIPVGRDHPIPLAFLAYNGAQTLPSFNEPRARATPPNSSSIPTATSNPQFCFPVSQAAPTNPLCWDASSPPGLYRSREHLRPAYPRRRPRPRDATRITHPCAERTAQPSHTVRRSRRPCRSLTRSRITRRQPWSGDIRLSAFRLFHPLTLKQPITISHTRRSMNAMLEDPMWRVKERWRAEVSKLRPRLVSTADVPFASAEWPAIRRGHFQAHPRRRRGRELPPGVHIQLHAPPGDRGGVFSRAGVPEHGCAVGRL